MSLQALNYVMELTEFPDGEPMDATDKAVAFVLANHHNPQTRVTWPSAPLIAQMACISLPTAKRTLAEMERHFLIRRVRPDNQGRGHFTVYRFLALDDPEALRDALRGKSPKGYQNEPLFCPPERGSEGVHRSTKRGSEGVQTALRNKEESGTVLNLESSTAGAVMTDQQSPAPMKTALRDWLAIKEQLRAEIDEAEFALWLRPMYLLALMSGNNLLVAVPPNGRILQAARSHLPLLRERVMAMGYGGPHLTRYPDEADRERMRELHPEFYEQRMFGAKARARA